jgi:hypothetical protein
MHCLLHTQTHAYEGNRDGQSNYTVGCDGSDAQMEVTYPQVLVELQLPLPIVRLGHIHVGP